MKHRELLQAVWTAQVPKRGQAATVQGELLRAVAKLEDEAQRQRELGHGHIRLLAFLRETLPPKGWGARGRRKQVLKICNSLLTSSSQ